LCGAGEEPDVWRPGDFILTHGDAFFSKMIRFGERLRVHGDDRKFTWFNHAALVIDDKGTLAEALATGVVRSPAEKYRPKEYVVVPSGASPEDVAEVLEFADWVLDTRHEYGKLTIVSIAFTLLTGSKFTFFVDGEFICSGFVARAMERTGVIFNRDPVHITPADLAKYYNATPPLKVSGHG
jgi:cell wall-associated NlpC family hydrolase